MWNVTNCMTDTPRWFYNYLWRVHGYRVGLLMCPLNLVAGGSLSNHTQIVNDF